MKFMISLIGFGSWFALAVAGKRPDFAILAITLATLVLFELIDIRRELELMNDGEDEDGASV